MEPLTSSAVEAALAAVEGERDPLRVVERLKGALGEELGRRAAELRGLRRRAARRLFAADRLLLTKKSLEQATAWPVARARARHVAARAPGATILDALAGLGADAMALAEADQPLVAAELDPELVGFLRHNLSVVGGAGPRLVVRTDACRPAVRAELILLDPDRRGAGESGARARARHTEAWTPPPGRALELLAAHAGGVLKLPPTLDPRDLSTPAGPHTWEWVSLGGEAKELTLWTGTLAEGRGTRRALVLTTDGEEHRLQARPPAPTPRARPALEELTVLAEADAAVVRAGLVAELAARSGLFPLGADFPYLGGVDDPPPSPFLRSFRIRGSEPLDRRRVRKLLRRFDVGPLVVKTRGVGASAAELAERFRGPGSERGWLVALGLAEGRRAFLVEPHPGPAGADATVG